MKLVNTLLIGSLVLAAACSTGDQSANQENEANANEAQAGNWYGEEFEIGEPMSLASLVAESESGSLEGVQVQGKINGVCKKKGCWMTLADGDNEMRVTFYDYGFFVPLDCEEKTATLQGVASLDTISVEVLQHYAEDAGQSEEEIAAITEPEYELVFEATGAFLE